MLRCTIELLPLGDESRAETIGVVEITNDGEGTVDTGAYDVRLMKTPRYARRPGVWKKGRVEGFPRLVMGPYDLLLGALMETCGGRLSRWWRK